MAARAGLALVVGFALAFKSSAQGHDRVPSAVEGATGLVEFDRASSSVPPVVRQPHHTDDGSGAIKVRVHRIPERGMVEATGLTIADQKNSRAIAADGMFLFVGTNTHVLKIHKVDMVQHTAFVMAPYITCTCMASTATHLYVGAVKGKAMFVVLEIEKSSMRRTHVSVMKNKKFGAVISLAIDTQNGMVLASRAGLNQGEIVRLSMAAMRRGADSSTAFTIGKGQVNALRVDGDSLWLATWSSPGWIIQTRLSDMVVLSSSKLAAGQNLLTALEVDESAVFVGTDAKPAQLVRLSKKDMTDRAVFDLPAAQGIITALRKDFK
jgi:hypothetical protein